MAAETGSIISKLFASAVGFQHELSLAAANFNLDFTLVKLEAPKEFTGVNRNLTKKRRDDAENGALHRTARKLGALFSGIAPNAPELLAAYGKRVSEISEKARKSVGKNPIRHILSDISGTDSASVWAAATSGENAIAVHLLACMVARMFDSIRAVSIWVELVESRKRQIRQDIENELDQVKAMAMDLAVKQDISIQELGAWDNSCRSWIQTADTVKSEEQKRALASTDNAGLSVNKTSDPYKSAMQAWQDAMTSMDSIVKGIPQKVRNGAVLLAMNSWHLYPNLCVLSRGADIIHQGDHLISSSGILTVDTEHSDDTGIVWSLPLSYLRHYGEPVHVTQRLSVSQSRISMDDFRHVLLGCVYSTWGGGGDGFVQTTKEANDLTRCLIEMLRWPESSESQDRSVLQLMHKITSRTSWIGQLLNAAEEFEECEGVRGVTTRKLIDHGRRNGSFLGELESHPAPFFGLSHIPTMFSLLNSREPRIAFLRQHAKDLGLSNSNCIIQYTVYTGASFQHEFATIAPISNSFGQDCDSGFLRQPRPFPLAETHVRWVSLRATSNPRCTCQGCPGTNRSNPGVRSVSKAEITKKSGLRFLRRSREKTSGPIPSSKNNCDCFSNGHEPQCSAECHDWAKIAPTSAPCMRPDLEDRMEYIRNTGEHCLPVLHIDSQGDPLNGFFDFGSGKDFQASLVDLTKPIGIAGRESERSSSYVPLDFCAGDPEFSGSKIVFVRTGPMTTNGPDPRKGRPGGNLRELGTYFQQASTIKRAIRAEDFDYSKLINYFVVDIRRSHRTFVKFLRGCAAAVEMYSRLPDTTVDASVVEKTTLTKARWIPQKEPPNASPLRVKLSRPQAFACIAMFDSVRLVEPSYLEHVFAMTTGNSIFVASPMLSDPYEVPAETEITRVPGNIGQPGLSFLVPPPQPRIRKANRDAWAFLNHKDLSGAGAATDDQDDPGFKKTSMHLRLTQHQPALPSLDNNEHYIEEGMALRETLVQVYDGAEWVCDLDILATLRDPLLTRVVCSQRHDETTSIPGPSSNSGGGGRGRYRKVAVDSWEELFTPPLDTAVSVVRTPLSMLGSEKWMSRLAVVGVSLRLGRPTLIVPEAFCLECVEVYIKELVEWDSKEVGNVVVIL